LESHLLFPVNINIHLVRGNAGHQQSDRAQHG
jgi:hypothetical protein